MYDVWLLFVMQYYSVQLFAEAQIPRKKEEEEEEAQNAHEIKI